MKYYLQFHVSVMHLYKHAKKENSLRFYVPRCTKLITDLNLNVYVAVCDRNQPVEVAVVSSRN